MPQPMETLAHGDAVLQEKAADLIDDRGPLANQAVAHAMQRLKIELLVRLCRDAPSRGTLHGFSDRMRIAEVVLVGLPKGLGIDWRHLPDIVADGEQFPGHIVRSHAGLDPDQAWRHIRKPGHNSVACHLLPQHDFPTSVQAYEVERILAWIDTNGDSCSVRHVRLAGHGVVLLRWVVSPACSLAGREHGRSIPFADSGDARRVRRNISFAASMG